MFDAPFRRYQVGEIFLSNLKFHMETLGRSCQARDVVTWMSRSRRAAPVRINRRNSRFFDRRRSRHTNMLAQSNCDKQTNENSEKIIASKMLGRLWTPWPDNSTPDSRVARIVRWT
jgi:hypothetical protein